MATRKPRPAPKPPGHPPYVPSDKDRVIVKLLCAGGIKQDRIAAAIGISVRTLGSHFKREIVLGQTEIDAQAIGALVSAMRGNGKQAVAAAKFWCQARMNWSEKLVVDDGRANMPMRVIVELVGDPAPAAIGASAARSVTRPGFDAAKHVQLVG